MNDFLKQSLKKGDEGELVKGLQLRLIEFGFKRCFLKDGSIGEIVPEGIFGDVTEACLESFQAKVIDAATPLQIPQELREKYPFTVDGTVDEADWYIIDNYEKLIEFYKTLIIPDKIEITAEDTESTEKKKSTSKKLTEKIIELARAELGVTEEKPYANTGEKVEEYQEVGSCKAVTNGGSPWCQYFMNWLWKKACTALGIDYKGLCSGYTPEYVNWGKKKGITYFPKSIDEVKVGDFFYVYSASRNNARHVGLVISKNGNNIVTIEGNTNGGGGAEGFGVFKRVRPVPWAVVRYGELYN